MNFKNLLIFLIFTSPIIISCGSSKLLMSDNLEFTLRKGGCFGSCPVYEMRIDNMGKVHYDGIRFTDKAGKHIMQLTKDDLKALTAAFEAADIQKFKDDYRSNIPDLPLITISYTNGQKSKTIKGKTERPQEVHDLQALLSEIADRDGYILVEEPKEEVVEEEDQEDDKEDNVIDGEFIVKFKKDNGFRIPKWLKNYSQYQLHVKNPLDAERTTWVVQHNKAIISSDEMLAILKADDALESVEPNKTLEQR